MRITKDKVVSIRYVMKNDSGEELENTMQGDPVTYLHGGSSILQSLQSQLDGLEVGDKKPVYLSEAEGSIGGTLVFEVIIDKIRAAQHEEILLGYPVAVDTEECSAECGCYK
jgi:FKBP-type peptidyl-prolyl cis-trans isomerase 2